jgi:CheY-like chemotaxis protein
MKKLKYGYKTATNGLEALNAYTTSPGLYCCVLMDISMPVMDGMESARRIREFERNQHVAPANIIALTGLASASAQQEAFASGIDMFMTKPVRLKQLADVLAQKHKA